MDAGASEPDLYGAKQEGNSAQQAHWRHVHRMIQWHITAQRLKGSSTECPSIFGIRPPACEKQVMQSLDNLSDDMIKRFCFKDCVLYQAEFQNFGNWRLSDLFSRIYRRWFPSRQRDVDLANDPFFCQYLAIQLPAMTEVERVKQVLGFHTSLSEQLAKSIPQLPGNKSRQGASPQQLSDKSLSLPPYTAYQLTTTFSKCFLVLRQHPVITKADLTPPHGHLWVDTGAIVVWLRADQAPEPVAGMKLLDADLGEAAVFECETMDCAMEYILSAAGADRSVKRREWHGKYQEILDQNTPMFEAPCQCWYLCSNGL